MRTRVALALFMASLSPLPMQSKLPVFPDFSAANLAGETVAFPAGLKGEYNVVLLGFVRSHQDDIDTWLAVLPDALAGRPKVAYYEVPVIDKLNPVIRWWINSGMKRGIPDQAQRARTVTFYIDKKKFRDSLGIMSEDRIYTLLINRAGEVLWRADGPCTEENKTALIRQLDLIGK